MDILIPMEWLWSCFSKEGYPKPKPFLDIHWKTMIENVLETLDISWRIILILSWKDVDNNAYIQKELENFKKKFLDIIFIRSYDKLEWAAKSCLKARKILKPWDELIVTYCDQLFDYNSEIFLDYARNKNFDWIITTCKNNEPKDDFLLYKEDKVLQLIPKKVVSDLATTWMYYWKDNELFLEWADKMISKNIRFNNKYYVWPIFNENINGWYSIGYYNIWVNQVWNPKDYEEYLKNKRYFLCFHISLVIIQKIQKSNLKIKKSPFGDFYFTIVTSFTSFIPQAFTRFVNPCFFKASIAWADLRPLRQ